MTSEASPGTVTLLFSDIEGSTRLLDQLGERYVTLLGDHHRIMDASAAAHGGRRVDAAGDGLFYSFDSAPGALDASVQAQRALLAHSWPDGVAVQSRMGLHTGEPLSAGTTYVGMDVHRAARICAAGHGGQILVTDSIRSLRGLMTPAGLAAYQAAAGRQTLAARTSTGRPTFRRRCWLGCEGIPPPRRTGRRSHPRTVARSPSGGRVRSGRPPANGGSTGSSPNLPPAGP